jgi:hypothetical protein
VKGPELIALDEPYEGWTMVLRIGSQHIFLSSPEDALLFLVQEYALNFVLPYWEQEPEEDEGCDTLSKVFAEAEIPYEKMNIRPDFSPDPKPTTYFQRYGESNLKRDIVRWASHFWPASVEVDTRITAVADELRSRMIGAGGWDESLSLVEVK